MNRFSFKELYIHKNNTTIAFGIISEFYNKTKKTIDLTVLWYNVGSKHEPLAMGRRCIQDISIPENKIKDWKVYKGSKFPKFKEWKQP